MTQAQPRKQSGANPQHLLMTIMGSYWSVSNAGAPSAGLVALLGEFGITASSARSALSRLSARGVLEATKSGRQTFYHLSGSAQQTGQISVRRVLRFGLNENSRPHEWDGMWAVVAFSIPETQRELRSALRARLRVFGFAAIQDGVWVAARPIDDEVISALADFGDEYVSAFESTLKFPGSLHARGILMSSHLEELRERYEAFIERYAPVREQTRRGLISPAEAFVQREQMVDEWRGFFREDPQLPDGMLPVPWPRQEAAELMIELFDALGPLAEMRCRSLLEPFGVDEDRMPRHFSSKDLS